jgi:polyhydroxybutyrate depolymerase
MEPARLARRLQWALVALGAALVLVPIVCTMRRLQGGEALELGAASYGDENARGCAPGERPGPVGKSDGERTAGGLVYAVRTPANYDATRAHPLIMVYAPHGTSTGLVERYVGLTREATAAGFVIAYAGSRDLSRRTILLLAEIPRAIARRWCIDETRIHLTGHSDGGTTAEALAFLPETRGLAASIAPSGAGIRGADLATETCPPPLPVLILHAESDWVFPGYGAEAARWWAKCNGCDVERTFRRPDGCDAFEGCAAGGETVLCKDPGGHLDWPKRNSTILEWFGR